MKTLDKLKDLREVAVQEILNDDSLGRYEKLEAIESNNLWETASWIQRPFRDSHYGKAFLEELKAHPDAGGYVSSTADDVLTEGVDNRGQTVYLSCFFEEDNPADYDTPEEYEEFLNEEVTILTSRGTPPRKMEISRREYLDFLWNWAITNKICAWKFDW